MQQPPGYPPGSPPGYGPPGAPQGYAPQGYPQQGYAPQGHPQQAGYGAPPGANSGVMVQGDTMLVVGASMMAPVCVKCGQATNGAVHVHEFEWMPTWARVLSYFGRLGRIISNFATKRHSVPVALCAPCTGRWKFGTWIPVLMVLGAFFAMFILAWGLGQIDPAFGFVGFMIGFVGFIVGAVVGGSIKVGRQLKVEKIDGTQIWLKGLHQAALQANTR